MSKTFNSLHSRQEEIESFSPLAQSLIRHLNNNFHSCDTKKDGQIMTFIEALGGDETTIKARKDLALQFINPFEDAFDYEGNHWIGKYLNEWIEWFKDNFDVTPKKDTGSTMPEHSVFSDVRSL